jgi:beta-glucosidase
MSTRKIALLGVSAFVAFAPMAQAWEASAPQAVQVVRGPWTDKSMSPDARATAILREMTPSEKLQLMFGYFSSEADFQNSQTKRFQMPKEGLPYSAGFIQGIPRLGIPNQWQTDAGVGVATQRSPTPRLRTALPSGIATAATWNPKMAFDGGAVIGKEARLSGFNVQLAGGMNLMREPRNGRNFEYGGEDPLLAGVITGNEIAGIQSNHIISTMKHFAFNGQETSRGTIDHNIEDQAARQSDLLAFQIANEIGKPGSVMCAFNRVNGSYACESDWLLNQVLKTDWGFKGYVMSDWGAVHSTIPAANNGLDQQSGWAFDRSAYFEGALREAVNNGHVSTDRVDDMVRRILYAMFANGVYDNPVSDQSDRIDLAANGKVSQADAEEGIVLLKNDNLLPLSKKVKRIAIIGGHADFGVLSGGGSSQVYAPGSKRFDGEGPENFPGPMTYYPSSPMKALRARTAATVTFTDGKDLGVAVAYAKKADLVIVFANQWTGESEDAANLNLPNKQDDLIDAVGRANKKTVVVLQTGGPVVMPWLNRVGAVLEAWYPGSKGGEAIARVLTGEVNPSGHLPATFPASLAQTPRPVLEGGGWDGDGHPMSDYNIDGAAVGYKWFDKKALKPLFAFGYGLSYTSFAVTDFHARPTGKAITVSLKITNSGKVDGKDAVQIYVTPAADPNWEAPKRLGAFTKVDLKAGESQVVELRIDPRLLATFDSATKTWTIKAGQYQVMTGNSAADLTKTTTVSLERQTLDVRGN